MNREVLKRKYGRIGHTLRKQISVVVGEETQACYIALGILKEKWQPEIPKAT